MSNDTSVNFYTPAQVVDLTISAGVVKAKLPLLKMLLLALLAGVFIALGAAVSSVVIHDISNIGIARFLAGVVFPAGLIMIVLCSGELFTGNCLMTEALMNHEIDFIPLLRNWVIVFIGNLIGSLLVVYIIYLSGQFNLSSGQLGAFTIKVAVAKVSLSPLTAFCSGIMCNLLVCVAVLLATAAKDTTGKIVGIFVPICLFVTGGFEHCVANMYYIPAGMLAALNPTYAAKATELYGTTSAQFATLDLVGFLGNLLPVTLGNIVGGAGLGIVLYLIHKSKPCNPID